MKDQFLSPLISVEEFQKKSQIDWVLIDARFNLIDENYGHDSYLSSRIPRAVRIDLVKDLCSEITEKTGRHPLKTIDKLQKIFQKIGLNNGGNVVIYDGGNNIFAIHLWWVLKFLGHRSVQVLEGGFKAWQDLGLSIETGNLVINPKEGNFTAKLSEFKTVDANEILTDLSKDNKELCVVDARGESRYLGEVESLDPIAGHIPFAINRPFELNLKANGRFKSPKTLKNEWLLLINKHHGQKIVHQCGSGISGCYNIFAMYYAGLGITALYPGSWSEWCKNPSYPIAKGRE